MSLTDYVTLGNSGLKVSRLCLGTMTFGTDWGWGSAEETARAIFNSFLDAGGNFIDTADAYVGGKSEAFIGRFVQARGSRDRIVLATKFSFNTDPGDPNAGGNGRKNILKSLDGSLRRLKTDYIDVYWLHNWDKTTPSEEVMRKLDDLVRAGKVRYIGISNAPAWYVARAQTIAEMRGYERLAALQLEYSLVERHIEFEYIPLALETGIGICPWSPLASGLLTGKYQRAGKNVASGEGRLVAVKDSGNPSFLKLFTERNWQIVDALLEAAKQVGRPPAQVALNWIANRPGVSSTLIGATKVAQLNDNIAALEIQLPEEIRKKLDEASRPETIYPYHFFERTMQQMITGGTQVRSYTAKTA